MNNLLTKFDFCLKEEGPAAIVLKQWLKPVGRKVIFPPTYANPSQKKGDPSVYNIDRHGETTTLLKRFERLPKTHTFVDAERTEQGREYSVCVIDSIPSQANRIEPAFARIAEGKLVPNIVVNAKVGDEEVTVSLLQAGHRAADAIVRFSSLSSDLTEAIKARDKGDSLPLAKLAPTSIVFGMWDSRASGVKVPRLITSMIVAYDVIEVRRSAQYVPALDYAGAGVVADKDETGLKKLADEGMAEVPATHTPGGIEAMGGICRDATLNLSTLRDITTFKNGKIDSDGTRNLQRYILGLSLVAITWFDGKSLNLRQGCQLVTDPERAMSRVLVNADGTESPFDINRDIAVEYAKNVAENFGVGDDRMDVKFDPKSAKEALKKPPKA